LGIKSEDISPGRIQQLSASSFYLKPGLPSQPRASAYEFSIVGLFTCTVVLSVTDLLTTSIALHSGLREGNVMLLAVAAFSRMNFFQTIAATKLGFISGTALLTYIGIKSNIHSTRRIVFVSLAAFVVLLLFVSLNNLVMINF
jgi:hypothetical protein